MSPGLQRAFGLLLFLPLAVPVSSSTSVLSLPEAKHEADIAISPEFLREDLTFIASDALQGRDTPSPGLDAAAEFLAHELKRIGAVPMGDDGTYFQHIPLIKRDLSLPDCALSVDGAASPAKIVQAQGWGSVSGAAVFSAAATPDAALVKGKVVFIPASVTRRAERAYIDAGAIGLVRDSGTPAADVKPAQPRNARFGSRYRVDAGGEAAAKADVPILRIDKESFAAITDGHKEGDSLKGQITLTVKGTEQKSQTQNVAAVLPGSDPKLKSEFVALGAHYDHLGIDTTKVGDQIYNGADDDGSGTVSILAIARAAAMGKRPKRSLLFVWHAGEEKGLWGSAYFNDHPTVPAGSIVAQLNIDMIGRTKKPGDANPKNVGLSGQNSVFVIGTTMMSTRLGEIVHETNKNYLKINYDSRYDDPKDPHRFFYRSDHYNYAKKGIPICFWFDGEHEDYHQVSDEVSKIDFTNMSNVAKTVFLTAVTVANEPARPAVDKPLNR